MNDEFEVAVKWDNGEEDVVYITDLVFDKTLFVYFPSDKSWTAKVTQIFDWNDFEVLWEKDKTKNCVTTKDVCPLNIDEFLGETVKWRDDGQIQGKIIRIGNKTIENQENTDHPEENIAKRKRYYKSDSEPSDSSSENDSSDETDIGAQETANEPVAKEFLMNIVENRSGLIRWTTA